MIPPLQKKRRETNITQPRITKVYPGKIPIICTAAQLSERQERRSVLQGPCLGRCSAQSVAQRVVEAMSVARVAGSRQSFSRIRRHWILDHSIHSLHELSWIHRLCPFGVLFCSSIGLAYIEEKPRDRSWNFCLPVWSHQQWYTAQLCGLLTRSP